VTNTYFDQDKLVEIVLVSLKNNNAEEIITIDLRGRSSMSDHLIIATGKSQRHTITMTNHLTRTLKQHGLNSSTEGMVQGDWVLIDADSIIICLFRSEVRKLYNLEGIWNIPN
jgi:ribosome-associated protein